MLITGIQEPWLQSEYLDTFFAVVSALIIYKIEHIIYNQFIFMIYVTNVMYHAILFFLIIDIFIGTVLSQ
jgi:hypothetical protein